MNEDAERCCDCETNLISNLKDSVDFYCPACKSDVINCGRCGNNTPEGTFNSAVSMCDVCWDKTCGN